MSFNMARQFITIAKFIHGVDSNLDACISSFKAPGDLTQLSKSNLTGCGLLFWSTYYDGWQMGDAFDPGRFDIQSSVFCNGVLALDLQSKGWQMLPRHFFSPNNYPEESWLLSRLHDAFDVFKEENHRATLLLARDVIGGSLDDDELLGR